MQYFNINCVYESFVLLPLKLRVKFEVRDRHRFPITVGIKFRQSESTYGRFGHGHFSLRMRRIGILYAPCPKLVITVVLTNIDLLQTDENFGDLTFRIILAIFLLRMRRDSYFSASIYN